MNEQEIDQIIDEEIRAFLDERCQKGYILTRLEKLKKCLDAHIEIV